MKSLINIFNDTIPSLIKKIITWFIKKTGYQLLKKNKLSEKIIFEKIWYTYNDLKFAVHPYKELGYNKWRNSTNFNKSFELLNLFRKQIDDAQITLNYKIIDCLKKIDIFYNEVINAGDQINPGEFDNTVTTYLKELNDIICEVFGKEFGNNIQLRP